MLGVNPPGGWSFKLEMLWSCSPLNPSIPKCALVLEHMTLADKQVWEARLATDEHLLFSAS